MPIVIHQAVHRLLMCTFILFFSGTCLAPTSMLLETRTQMEALLKKVLEDVVTTQADLHHGTEKNLRALLMHKHFNPTMQYTLWLSLFYGVGETTMKPVYKTVKKRDKFIECITSIFIKDTLLNKLYLNYVLLNEDPGDKDDQHHEDTDRIKFHKYDVLEALHAGFTRDLPTQVKDKEVDQIGILHLLQLFIDINSTNSFSNTKYNAAIVTWLLNLIPEHTALTNFVNIWCKKLSDETTRVPNQAYDYNVIKGCLENDFLPYLKNLNTTYKTALCGSIFVLAYRFKVEKEVIDLLLKHTPLNKAEHALWSVLWEYTLDSTHTDRKKEIEHQFETTYLTEPMSPLVLMYAAWWCACSQKTIFLEPIILKLA